MTYSYNKSSNSVSINWSDADKNFFLSNGATVANRGFTEIHYGINEEPTTFLRTESYTPNPVVIPLTNIAPSGGYYVFTFKVKIYSLDAVGGVKRWQWVTYGGVFIDNAGLHCTVVDKSVDNTDLLFYWIALNQDYSSCNCSYLSLIKIKNIFDTLLENKVSESKDCGCNG